MQKYTCRISELSNIANANTRALLLRRIKAKLDLAKRVMRAGKKKEVCLKNNVLLRLLNCGQGNEKGDRAVARSFTATGNVCVGTSGVFGPNTPGLLPYPAQHC